MVTIRIVALSSSLKIRIQTLSGLTFSLEND